ncbi:hypothetical protein [Brevundimonas diminuta]|uniref:hypothetical protein n=1 Tax=Brevundimonas diminuta TaxID=293 RepID=UPI0028B04C8E|nr:hypothetical protein [Brevundimonas diminuta]
MTPRARVNAAQENDSERAEPEASHWLLGSKSGAAGSLHCDLWRGRVIELAGLTPSQSFRLAGGGSPIQDKGAATNGHATAC